MIRALGRTSLHLTGAVGDFTLFTTRAASAAWRTRHLGRRLIRAVYEQGARCMPVIVIVGLFTGLVLGLQGFYVLQRFGSESLLGTLVSLSLIRELGPVLAALMLIGQAGSALAAELGMQRQTEQIAALEVMGIDSHGYLVTPRLLAAALVFPLQAALFVVVGLWGGALSGSALLGVDAHEYWSAVDRAITWPDARECFLKALTFGMLATALCSYHGYHADRVRAATGAQAVSAATTRAVVQSSIAVLAVDYVITSLLV